MRVTPARRTLLTAPMERGISRDHWWGLCLALNPTMTVGPDQVKLLDDDESVHSFEQFRSLFRALSRSQILLKHRKLICQQLKLPLGIGHGTR